jgi:hypothetical protein
MMMMMMMMMKETEKDGISLGNYGQYLSQQESVLLYDQKKKRNWKTRRKMFQPVMNLRTVQMTLSLGRLKKK